MYPAADGHVTRHPLDAYNVEHLKHRFEPAGAARPKLARPIRDLA
jgi:hypothetical protein